MTRVEEMTDCETMFTDNYKDDIEQSNQLISKYADKLSLDYRISCFRLWKQNNKEMFVEYRGWCELYGE